MSFQHIVITGASIILICCLILIGFFLSKKSRINNDWKPDIGDCPDYFIKVDDSSKPNTCVANLLDTSITNCDLSKEIDFTNMSICDKFKWANKCNVQWDGISNDYPTIKKCK